MILPLYVALEKIDPRLLEAARTCMPRNRVEAFRRVTLSRWPCRASSPARC